LAGIGMRQCRALIGQNIQVTHWGR
jgi:hypothetical protein